MTVKEAVVNAKEAIATLFEGEGIADIGLEGVEVDAKTQDWLVTIGFSRAWEPLFKDPVAQALSKQKARTYKVVRLSESGELRGVTPFSAVK
jgi:hypothetical protein